MRKKKIKKELSVCSWTKLASGKWAILGYRLKRGDKVLVVRVDGTVSEQTVSDVLFRSPHGVCIAEKIEEFSREEAEAILDNWVDACMEH